MPQEEKDHILEEIKKLYSSDMQCDENCVSVYDLFYLMHNKLVELNLNGYQAKLEDRIQKHIDPKAFVTTAMGFIVPKRLLTFTFYSNGYKDVYLSKIDGNLVLARKNERCSQAEKVLECCRDILSQLFDDYEQYQSFFHQCAGTIQTTNPLFVVNLVRHQTELQSVAVAGEETKYFRLSSHNSKAFFLCGSHLSEVKELVRGNEEELLKRVFLRIEDCPECLRDDLYKLREKDVNHLLKKKKNN